MGLNRDDPLPMGTSLANAYTAIRKWCKVNARRQAELGNQHAVQCSDLVAALPPAEQLTELEIRAVLGEVIYGSLEWAYHQSDGRYKMAAYAHAALDNAHLPLGISSEEKVALRESFLAQHLSNLVGFDPELVVLPFNHGIVTVSGQVWAQLLDRLRSRPEELKTLNWRAFEELIAELWQMFGYEVELTQKTRDGGRDIIAIGSRLVYEKFLIECKRPGLGTKIGVRPVRELYGVKISEGATKGILATTAYFSKDAKLMFEKHKWELEGRDFDGLLDWINNAKKPAP